MPKTLPPLLAEIGRFLAAGVGNTLLTIGVYQVAVSAMSPLMAYVLAWCVGIGLVMGVYPKFVFKREATLLNAGAMGAMYLIAFAIGCGVTLLCTWLQVPDRAIIIIAAGVTSLISYVGGRQLGTILPSTCRGTDKR
jgi:putative flippase GtrA